MGCFSSRKVESDSESSHESETEETLGPAQKLEEHIYFGSEEAGKSWAFLRERNITSVCGIGWNLQEYHKDKGVKYHLTNKILDAPEQDIMPSIKPSLEFIDTALNNGENILIHCHKGISRSATLVTAYIMRNKKKTLDEALSLVRSKRKIAIPSLGFEVQLYFFQKYNYSLDLDLYANRSWEKQLESYLEEFVLPKTKKLADDATNGRGYSGKDLYVLTCNWLEPVKLDVHYGKIDAMKDEAVQILRQMQIDHVKDANTLKAFDQWFGLDERNI